MLRIQNKKLSHIALSVFMAVSGLSVLAYTQHVHAAAMTETFVLFNNITTSATTGGTVCVKPATPSADVKTWTVTFPTGYGVNTTGANWQTVSNIDTSSTVTWPTGAIAWPNATSATATVSGQTVTWTNSSVQNMGTSNIYCYNWTNLSTATISSSASSTNSGTVATQDHLAATIDSGTYATPSVTSANDTITVNATVPPTFSLTLNSFTDNLPTLSSSAPVKSSSAVTATVNTNAKNGWTLYAKDANAGLHSAFASYTIPTNCSGGAGSLTTLTNGSELYNTGITAKSIAGGTGTGSYSLNPNFDNTAATNYRGGGLCTTYQYLATDGGSADTATLSLVNSASVKGSTPAATDFTDTITLTGAGLF